MARSMRMETPTASWASSPVYQAFLILLIGFTAAPLIAGADKFFGILTDWTQYLAPVFPNLLGISAQSFMYAVGIIEIVAGLIVLSKPSIGGYVVAGWLFGIIVNLLLLQNYYDIALRDLGLSLGALALARLASHFGR
jgi:hypothetical protein